MVQIDHITWDTWNIAHIVRHSVTVAEVEEVCYGTFITQQGYSGRFLVIGQTSDERTLAVVLEPQGAGEYYVVTARPASRRERRDYQENIG